MAEPSYEIERIVREVLAELQSAGATAPSDGASPSAGEGAAPAATAQRDGELYVASRVVTMAELADRLDGVRRVVVSPGSLVTPLVRDELRRRSLMLVYERAQPVARPAAPVRLVLVTLGKSYDPAGLIRTLQADGIPVEGHGTDCLVAASDIVTEAVRQGDAVGAILTRYTAIGLCTANRLAGVRAVLAADAAETAAACQSVGANVLVLSPRAMSPYQLRRMLGEFVRAGVRPCPENLKHRLA